MKRVTQLDERAKVHLIRASEHPSSLTRVCDASPSLTSDENSPPCSMRKERLQINDDDDDDDDDESQLEFSSDARENRCRIALDTFPSWGKIHFRYPGITEARAVRYPGCTDTRVRPIRPRDARRD
jgi:hypothetical protein